MTSLVHAFVMSRVDYCNVVFAGAPKAITDRLQRVLNTAARVLCYWYPEVRPRSEAADNILSSTGLMHLSASSISSVGLCLCVAVWMELFRDTLHPSLCDCLKTSSSFCCQSSVCCAVLSTEFIRTFGFRCRRPDDVELTAETFA